VTKDGDSVELDFLALVEFLRLEDVNELEPTGGSAPRRRLLRLLTAGARPMKSYDLGKLRNDLNSALKNLFADDTEFSQEERLEVILAQTQHKNRPPDSYDEVSPADRRADYSGPYPIITIGRTQYVIKTIKADSPINVLYRVLDNAIRSDLLQKLRLCPTCKQWFFRMTKRKNYCSDRCAPSSSKDRQKQRAKHSRQRKAKAEKQEAFLKKLEEALRLMSSKKVADQQAISPLVRKLGGWPKVKPWEGKTAADVYSRSTKAVQQMLKDGLGSV
jgi:hypothetical protein